MFGVVLAPHNDDETLFMAYTVMRNKPLVIIITDGYNQKRMGFEVNAEQRRLESIEACRILGAPVVFLGIKDTEITEDILAERLSGLSADIVYAPAIQGGHKDHDLVSRVAVRLFGDRVRHYSTYSKEDFFIQEGTKVVPIEAEMLLKNEALNKYVSQIRYSKPHFDEVRGKPEWFIC